MFSKGISYTLRTGSVVTHCFDRKIDNYLGSFNFITYQSYTEIEDLFCCVQLDNIFPQGYIPSTAWEVEYTDEFEKWWDTLDEGGQVSVTAIVQLLEVKGPQLPHPYSSGINNSRHSHMRELRIQHGGEPYRVLYAFDPRRAAILLIGGNKVGNDRWYDEYIPVADNLYDEHLATLEKEESK